MPLQKLLFAVLMLPVSFSWAQTTTQALPHYTYKTMVEYSTSADITLLQGNGGSIAVDKANIGLLKDFIENTPATKITTPETATLMCLIDGREYISGSIYLQSDKGFVVFRKDGQEFVNELNTRGAKFLREMMTQ